MATVAATAPDLKRLPLRALLAYAARCAKRVRPMFAMDVAHPDAAACPRALDSAIRVAEEFASGRNLSPETVRRAEEATVHVLMVIGNTSAPPAAAYAANAAYAAACATRAAMECLASEDPEQAAGAVVECVTIVADAAASADPAVERAARLDWEMLHRMRLGRFPEVGEPVNPAESGILGPLFAGQAKRAGRTEDEDSAPPPRRDVPPPSTAAAKPAPPPVAEPPRPPAKPQLNPDELRERKEKLEADAAALKADRETLRVERESLRADQETLRKEREELRAERDALRNEREAIRTDRETLRQERETLEQDRRAFRSEQDAVRQEQEALRRDRDAFLEEQKRFKEEMQKSSDQDGTAQHELKAVRQQLKAERADLKARRDSLVKKSQELEEARVRINKDAERLRAAKAELEAQRQQLEAASAELARRDSGTQQTDEARAALEAERQALEDERRTVDRRKAELDAAWRHFQSESDAAERARAESAASSSQSELAVLVAALQSQLEALQRDNEVLQQERAALAERLGSEATPRPPAEAGSGGTPDQLLPIRLVLEPGLATDMQIAELFYELTAVAGHLGLHDLRFNVRDARALIHTTANGTQQRFLAEIEASPETPAGDPAPDRQLWEQFRACVVMTLGVEQGLGEQFLCGESLAGDHHVHRVVGKALRRAQTAYARHRHAALPPKDDQLPIDVLTQKVQHAAQLLRQLARDRSLLMEMAQEPAAEEPKLDAEASPAPRRRFWTRKKLLLAVGTVTATTLGVVL